MARSSYIRILKQPLEPKVLRRCGLGKEAGKGGAYTSEFSEGVALTNSSLIYFFQPEPDPHVQGEG